MNPLLSETALPLFEQIKIEHFEPAIDEVLADNKQLIKRLLASSSDTWDSLVYPLESADNRLNYIWSVISHYNAVLNSDALRDIYKSIISKLTEYQTEVGQNEDLFQAYKRLSESAEYVTLNEPQKKVIDNSLRDFKLSGIGLNAKDKQQYSELKQTLSALTNNFSENVLDATQGWSKYIASSGQLAGLPESALQLLASLAKDQGHESGYLLTLDIPSYLPVMTYCEDADLREELYKAYLTRASDQGPNAGKWDNSENIQKIMAIRQSLAKLLSFDNYAHRSLATKMAGSVEEVMTFLEQLAEKALPVAKKEILELEAYAKDAFGRASLESWDVGFYSEKLRQERFDVSQEELKPYFPVPVVLNGMFEVAKRLFDIEVKARPDIETCHEDSHYYSIYVDGQEVAGFYLDMYTRKNKRGGAWMADCRVRRRLEDGSLQLPVANLVCNFTPPVDGNDSLLTHNEVTTLFHEFGHGLHHMLTQIEVADVSGISGVPWDVVELPSQFLENWCWQEESIPLISRHFETGESLPKVLLDKMLAAKYFQGGMAMMRQLELSMFDFQLHRDFSEADKTDVLALIDTIRKKVSVKLPPDYSRFSHSFSHIFAGGYAAGYYSYKWAEVLAADAFSRFEEEGIFNKATGLSYKQEILEVGGSKDAMDMFVSFRGRKPSVDPLLKQAGIQS
jgi:oligopeptidase A